MNQLTRILVFATVSILSGCSTMNSQFSCSKTAGDGCLSMDEVDAMTEGKTIQTIQRTSVSPVPLLKGPPLRFVLPGATLTNFRLETYQ